MERKYRQHGYQDKDWDDQKRERRPPERQSFMPDAPKGHRHAMNREAAAVIRCAACGKQVTGLSLVEVKAICGGCGAALHACRNCQFFDSAARFQCRKPIEAAIKSKAKANSCDEFAPRKVLDSTGRRAEATRPRDARSDFDALFKK